jgi:hypothetical protein
MMNRSRLVKIAGAAIFSMCSLTTIPAFAQIDLSGQWQAINQQDAHARGPGPDLADYTGLPLSAEGRAVAISYNYSMLSMTERMCMDYSEDYITFAPHSINIERVDDPVTGGVQAWKISAGGSDRAPIPIWVDGLHPRPDPWDLHTYSGYTIGEWEDGVLTGLMTHMKKGISRRNGAPLSDQATMTLHLVRNGSYLTIMTLLEDPIYLTEPLVQTGSYRLNVEGNTQSTNPTCFPSTEIPSLDPPGSVPNFVPGSNPNLEEFAQRNGLPSEAVMGGAETMYPEFRKKIKDTYTPPAKCLKDCVGAGS